MGMKVVQGTTRRGFLKNLGSALGGAAIGGAALLLKPKSVEANGSAWWETVSQSQRDMYILNRAQQLNGQSGGECKVWVQDVVRYVSVSHVQLPLNNPAPYDWYWQYDPYGHAVGMCLAIEYVTLGQIVQMKFKTNGTPHTAIVGAKDGNGFGFWASNDPIGSYTVRYRYWKFADFKAAVYAYTVYSIH